MNDSDEELVDNDDAHTVDRSDTVSARGSANVGIFYPQSWKVYYSKSNTFGCYIYDFRFLLRLNKLCKCPMRLCLIDHVVNVNK